jgi:LPXTG-motif cell wall-anchored protein
MVYFHRKLINTPMKKFSFILIAFFVMFFAVTSKADVAIVSLPYTFDATHTSGGIDMNGDEIADFYIYYESTGDYCRIMSGDVTSPLNSNSQNPPLSIPSTGGILGELTIASPAAPLTAKPPLSRSDPAFTTILTKGTPIGSTPPSGSIWIYSAHFFDNGYFISPLESNFYDGVYSGYVGVYYTISGDTYYGWLNVEIDEDKEWVKINSSGHASAPASPVPAGLNDPFAVPVPLVATLIGFSLIGGGILFRRRRNKK